MKLYTITGVALMTEDIFKAITSFPKCFGVYTNLEKAREDAENNCGNMHESKYDYIIIEEIEEGVYPTAKIVGLFKFSNGKFSEIQTSEFKNYIENDSLLGYHKSITNINGIG